MTSVPFTKEICVSVFSLARRLRAERKAGENPFDSSPSQMDRIIGQSLSRMQKGNLTESWWQEITNYFSHQIIFPEFLNKPVVQKWLSDQQVASSIKKEAIARIMGNDGAELESAELLAEKYAEFTGEAKHFATVPIYSVVAILVAGFLASVPKNLETVVAMLQQFGVNLQSGLEKLEHEKVSQPYLLASKQALTANARNELSRILSIRFLDTSSSICDLRKLLDESEHGTLAFIDSAVKAEILYWTARLCATSAETVELAKQLRNKLQQYEGSFNLLIVDAIIESTDGRQDEALQILRDRKDSDSHSVFFHLLVTSKSDSAALSWYERENEENDIGFFTPVGWCNWAVIKANCGDWNEILEILPKLESHWEQTPMLAVIEGTVNSAKLLPEEYRSRVLNGAPLYTGISPRVDDVTPKYHKRATDCFEFAISHLRNQLTEYWASILEGWQIWLSLMNPDFEKTKISRMNIANQMQVGANAARLIPIAYSFGIDFDDEPLANFLKYRNELGGLNEEEKKAEFFLKLKILDGTHLLNYIETNKSRLQKLLPEEFLDRLQVISMLSANVDPTKVKSFIQDSAIEAEQKNTLMVLIDAGQDVNLGEQLKLRYEQTRSLFDLKNCVLYSKFTGDYENLKSFARRQFEDYPNVENALDYVMGLANESTIDYESIIKFLEENSEITRQSRKLRMIEVQALIFAGRLVEAKEINDDLLSEEVHPYSIQLDLDIAVASGDWERMAGILDCAWQKRDSFQAEHLLNFAQLSGLIVQTDDRALQFANTAVKKAPNNPRILAGAYFLYYQLGHEKKANEQWLHKAVELSSNETGPFWSINPEKVVNEWIPQRRGQFNEIERKWLDGEIPITLFAKLYNLSLANTLLRIPMANAREPDFRRKSGLWTIAADREIVEMQGTWTIGLDTTTVMVLSYLGLLDQVIDSFCHVKIAPELSELLIQDFIDAKFQQPSRIESAKNFLQLFDEKAIKSVNNSNEFEQSIADETGLELANLIHSAQKNSGKVVCTYPISKAGSLYQDEADISEFRDLIIPIMDFCKYLHDFGKIDETEYKLTHTFLSAQGQTSHNTVVEPDFDCPVYLEGLAVKYLQDTQILQPIVNELDVYVHQNLMEEYLALSHEEHIGSEVRNHIEEIRLKLKAALSNGKASLTPRSTSLRATQGISSIGINAVETLLRDNDCCDAICFDDRFFNHNTGFTRSDGNIIPIVCILDILQFLYHNNHIQEAEYINYRHKLRISGFSSVLPEIDELNYLLNQVKINDENVIESKELRVFRQYTASLDSIDSTNFDEARKLAEKFSIVGRHAIARLWTNPEIPPSKASALSNWLWNYLVKSTGSNYRILDDSEHASLVEKAMSFHLGGLLLPAPIESSDRYEKFTCWVENNILFQLLPANSELIQSALRLNLDVIQSSSRHDRAAYSRLYIDQLPNTAFRILTVVDHEFKERYGYKSQYTISIEKDIKILDTELYKAAREFYSTGKEKSVNDVDGNTLIVGLGETTGNIVVKRIVEKEKELNLPIPPLRLLSPDVNVRNSEISRISDNLGPTSSIIDPIAQLLNTRELNDQELFSVFDELAHGVASKQNNLLRKLVNRQELEVDHFVPPNISYYEKFCGPQPTTTDVDSYRHNTLIPYRKNLISRDLRKGLDICCLGSFTDDLCPGIWINDLDNDTVWNAIPTLEDNHNPFWLLGALDIAWYRLDDSRFRNYAAAIIDRLIDLSGSDSPAIETFNHLANIADFVLNRINTIANGARCPIYWKRMAAWMQAGFIVRAITEIWNTETLNNIQNWTKKHKYTAGIFSTLVDCRVEHVVLANSLSSHSLRINIGSRLRQILSRHSKAGNDWQNFEELKSKLTQLEQESEYPELIPNLFEGHCSPQTILPIEESSVIFGEDYNVSDQDKFEEGLRTLLSLSQQYKLGKNERLLLKNLIEYFSLMVMKNNSTEDNLVYLDTISIIVAGSHCTEVADDVSQLLVQISSKVEAHQIGGYFTVIFQSAAVFEDYDKWFNWLEDTLSEIAMQMPSSSSQNEVLSVFLQHLLELDLVLPVSSWFHKRAKAIASSGARI